MKIVSIFYYKHNLKKKRKANSELFNNNIILNIFIIENIFSGFATCN